MKMRFLRSYYVAILLAILSITPAAYCIYTFVKESSNRLDSPVIVDFEVKKEIKILEPGVEIDVKACKIFDGYIFGVVLGNGTTIEAHLSSATKEEATPVVIETLNTHTSLPTVTLKRKVGKYWIVDFNINVNGQRTDLLSVLREKGLVY